MIPTSPEYSLDSKPTGRPGAMSSHDGPGQPPGEGSLFGKYQLITRLGQGGMATVYLAVARAGVQDFRKLVVLKLLNENLLVDQQFVSMFLREARIAAELAHPNVVQTYTVGREGDRHYILMEYLEGVSLGEIMKRSKEWSLHDRLPLIGSLCLALSGLKYVHEFRNHQGNHLELVHRDVKPDNIFITTSGQVKLLDFGVAKATSPEFEKTFGATVKGTVQYIPPESVQPDVVVDSRGDVFSAGVILAELATGRRYWDGVTYPRILARLASGDLPALSSDLGEEVPPALARICLQALQPNRDNRFATALDLRKAIQGFLVRQGYRLDTAALAGIVSRIFEPTRQARGLAIQQCLAAVESSSQVMDAPLGTFRGGTMEGLDRATEPAAPGPDQTVDGIPMSDPIPAAQPLARQPWIRYVIIGVLLALVVSIGWYALTPGGKPPSTPPTRDTPAAGASGSVKGSADDDAAPKASDTPRTGVVGDPTPTPTPTPTADAPPAGEVEGDADPPQPDDGGKPEVAGSSSDRRPPAARRRRSRRGSRGRPASGPATPAVEKEPPRAEETKPPPRQPPKKQTEMEPNPYAR